MHGVHSRERNVSWDFQSAKKPAKSGRAESAAAGLVPQDRCFSAASDQADPKTSALACAKANRPAWMKPGLVSYFRNALNEARDLSSKLRV
jgi:hypothetical protein